MTSHPTSPLRILCLHGYRQSASVFRVQTRALREALATPDPTRSEGALAQLLYLDAPYVVERNVPGRLPTPVRAHAAAVAGSGRRGAAEMAASPASRTPERSWGLPEPAKWPTAERLLLSALVDLAPIDGLLGFSQGATVAAALVALTNPPPTSHASPPISPDAVAALAGVRFIILIGGFPPRFHLSDRLTPLRPMHLPSLHMMGEADRRIPAAASRALALCFSPGGRVMHVHGGGHTVPVDAASRARLVAFVTPFAGRGAGEGDGGHL